MMNLMHNLRNAVLTMFLLFIGLPLLSQELYTIPQDAQTRWISFENQTGEKGRGGMENKGAKGHAMDHIKAGESKVLFDVKGSGIIHRMWITIDDKSPEMLRSLKIEMFWDGADKAAVVAPFGDFFGVGLGRMTSFENELFSNPEGKSFNSYIPMPFKTAARIVITNESPKDLLMIFYDINYTVTKSPDPNSLYFHCYWNREIKTELGRDFEILPTVAGKGRFIGTNIGVVDDSAYQGRWWGEGEVKVFLDGDTDYPTLVGTGTEDYIGTGWGQGIFRHRFQGCLIADKDKHEWAFYRYHIPDPIYFHSDCKVTIQQIGGDFRPKAVELQKTGVAMTPISIHSALEFIKLLEMDPVPDIDDETLPDNWTNFYRQDDWSAAAYFYLDKPESNLPDIAPVEKRIEGLTKD
ncbi:MAG: DUF2961 domain-containing protein [Bacteroidales bacterium]|nr:DUF2961 domain-containing protein [Bacteroidales bacterium]